MKTINKIILLLLIPLLASSCKDWLYLQPENGIIVEDYWKSKADVHASTMACYVSLLSSSGSGYSVPQCMFYWGELRAEMVSEYRTSFSDFTYIRNGDILPTSKMVNWDSFYGVINNCNILLEKAPQVLDLDESFSMEDLQQYSGEVLALRALMYFYLTRAFDEVPLVLEATTSDDKSFKKAKSTRDEIYAQIVADLTQAEGWVTDNYGINSHNKGRITKYTVNAILADVYLWMDEYEKSVEACDKIINSGEYGLVPGDQFWFETLFVNGNSSESIFELQYDRERLNPFFDLFETQGQLRANNDMMESIFPIDIYAHPDSADIRSDGAAYKSSRNYSLWKYIGISKFEANTAELATNNFIVYRYADVLLMKAEGLAMMGGRGEEALALIDQIRNRANATKESAEGRPTDTDGLINYIMSERNREFAFEGKRWWDILRNAKRENYARAYLIRNMVTNSAPANRLINVLTKYEDPLSHYFPIAQKEIDAAFPLLEQNPFYVSVQ